MAQVPQFAEAAAVRLERAIRVAPVAGDGGCLASADEGRLRGAAALDAREPTVDEVSVRHLHRVDPPLPGRSGLGRLDRSAG